MVLADYQILPLSDIRALVLKNKIFVHRYALIEPGEITRSCSYNYFIPMISQSCLDQLSLNGLKCILSVIF